MRKSAAIWAILLVSLSLPSFAQGMDYTPGFDPGAPAEMNTLPFKSGQYKVSLYFPSTSSTEEPDWLKWADVTANFADRYDGALWLEDNVGFPIQPGNASAGGLESWSYLTTWTYDRFNKVFRAIYHDNVLGLADIYEGKIEDGKLILSNLNTSTYNTQGTDGGRQKNRIIIKPRTNGSFVLNWFTLDAVAATSNIVADQKWIWSVKMEYSALN